jgi:hypothetical protein
MLCGVVVADPVAGLMMTAIIIKEGLEALRGRACSELPT